MNSKVKILFSITSFLLILSLFALVTFETIHAGHEENCHEENCPLCLVLQIIKSNIKNTGTSFILKNAFHFIFEDLLIGLFILHFISITPVTKKIKLTI